jgi:hypothetical protein
MHRLLATIDSLADTAGRWWLCTRHGHDYTDRSTPPACRDCGRTRKAPR